MDAFLLLVLFGHTLAGHNDFHVREAAQDGLYRLPEAVLATINLSDDPEVKDRSRRSLKRYLEAWWLAFEKEQDALGWPWMDSLPYEVREGFPVHDPETVGGTDYEDYKMATKWWAKAKLDGGMPRWEVAKILAAANVRCQFWRENRRYPE